jgi:hydroxymethylglutaryl-CoA reductase (NADPH)
LRSDSLDGEFYLPLATTEGALIGSVSRGSKAISKSGGVNSFALRIGTTRGPVFYVESLENNKKLRKWLQDNENVITKIPEPTSPFIKYIRMTVSGTSDYVYVNFYYDTQDAMGMNMATIATQLIADYIEKETGFKNIAVAGNFDSDKKPSWANFINGRGFQVRAEATIQSIAIESILKSSADKIFEVWLSKCMLGSAMVGSLGFNSHFANIVAAFYIATGQDPAHVVEGSMGVTSTKVLPNKDLYISVYLPAVMIATVGGGTNLKTQQEAQKILGVTKSYQLAEILGGAVMAGELSLLAALAEGTLSKAHETLGR